MPSPLTVTSLAEQWEPTGLPSGPDCLVTSVCPSIFCTSSGTLLVGATCTPPCAPACAASQLREGQANQAVVSALRVDRGKAQLRVPRAETLLVGQEGERLCAHTVYAQLPPRVDLHESCAGNPT